MGKYISLEAKIAKNKDLYYQALREAQIGWHEGNENVIPFIKYFLGVVLSAYRDFEERFFIVADKVPAIEMVRRATQGIVGKFTKQDILTRCPSLSLSSVEGSLRKLTELGELNRAGSGRASYYFRVK